MTTFRGAQIGSNISIEEITWNKGISNIDESDEQIYNVSEKVREMNDKLFASLVGNVNTVYVYAAIATENKIKATYTSMEGVSSALTDMVQASLRINGNAETLAGGLKNE